MCALFAATYPEKTRALVPDRHLREAVVEPDYPWAPTREAREAFHHQIHDNWGGPIGLEERAPSMTPIRHSARGGQRICAWAQAPARRLRSPR
jgi:hypothetical protein